MKTSIQILAIMVFVACLTGCIPKVHVLAPGITGTIIDNATGQPINDAAILDKHTDQNGHFIVPAEKELGLTFPFVGGHYLIETPFVISASGYQSRSCSCTVATPAQTCGKVVISLQKLSAENDLSKESRGQIIMINLDATEPLEGGVTCLPLQGETTVTELEDAARDGSVKALYLLGTYHLQGIFVEKNIDLGRYYMEQAAVKGHSNALKYFFSLARQGDPASMVFVGDLLYLGTGVEQDIKRGMQWYMAAVQQDSPLAMLRLGEAYSAGEFITINERKALFWYHKASETGLAKASYQLAENYRYGLFTSPNQKLATHWYVKAAEAGSEQAADFLLEIIAAENLSATEKQEALEWQSRHKQ